MVFLHMRFPGGKTKAVTLSYDDGVSSDLRLAELADKYGVKCAFNINSGLVPDEPGGGKLTYAQIKEHLLGRGHEVAVHGELHRAPGAFPTLIGLRDALNCREQLERNLGVMVRGMAYPNSGITRFTGGSDYAAVRDYLSSIGVVYARSLGADNDSFRLPEDWFRWIPTAHHGNPDAPRWAREFADLRVNERYGDDRWPRLFYLWGHSYEFDRDGNWDLLEELLGVLGNLPDAWYATGIAIWSYVTAFHSLVFSADASFVYKPTLQELWFETDEKMYSVRPGETVTIS